MKPLNPTEVVWLAGSAAEIDLFLKSEAVRDHGVILGHPDDARRTLLSACQPGVAFELNFMPLLNGQRHLKHLDERRQLA